jgi:hypothetical protein
MPLPHVIPRITLSWQTWSIAAIVLALAVAAALLLMMMAE